jgi:hypothetical protein
MPNQSWLDIGWEKIMWYLRRTAFCTFTKEGRFETKAESDALFQATGVFPGA